MNISNKSNYEVTISNLTSIDLVVLAAMPNTDLKTMIKISALELVKSCEKFFDLEMMQKMNHDPSPELKTKIQNWLNSIEYKQYTQNTNQTLSVKDKESIRKIYSKLGLKPHDLSELTQTGELFLENKIKEIKNKWKILINYNKSNNSTKLKEEIDKCSKIIPMLFTIGIANPSLFSEMFKTMNLSMYDYLSKNKNIHPIFLDYLK